MKRKILLLITLIAALVLNNEANAQIVLYVDSPATHAGNYDFSYSSSNNWGADMDTIAITAPLAIIRDNTTADTLGCETTANVSEVAGKIAVVYRGVCEFGKKSIEAENAGAVAIIIINNVPGGTISMGAGAVGNTVTIPVLMISMEDGALLRPSIDAGEVVAFIGNKTGLFAHDIGIYKEDIVMASSFSVPSSIAEDSTYFEVPVGAYVSNYGYDTLTNVVLTAKIEFNSTSVIYADTADVPLTLNPGEFAFVSLSKFAQGSYAEGYYTITYSATADSADGFEDDNSITSNFLVNESLYSKSRVDPTTIEPLSSGGIRIVETSGSTFTWCITLDSKKVGLKEVHGLSFSASSRDPQTSLVDVPIVAQFLKWNDPFGTVPPPMTDLELLREEYYDYVDDLQDVFVGVNFRDPTTLEDSPITLEANTRYLACVKVNQLDVFIGSDNTLDYTTNIEHYEDAYFPLHIPGASPEWSSVGFGSATVPAIIVHFDPVPVGIEETKITNPDTKPYPNPASEFISIPLKEEYKGMVELKVFDITGKIVKSETINMSNTNALKVNTTSVENGIYYFQLKGEDNKLSSFPVVISH